MHTNERCFNLIRLRCFHLIRGGAVVIEVVVWWKRSGGDGGGGGELRQRMEKGVCGFWCSGRDQSCEMRWTWLAVDLGGSHRGGWGDKQAGTGWV